jgi:hypothetical protein
MKTKLTCWSNEAHLSQVYTGLTMLHRRGTIDLEQIVREPPAPNPHPDCPPHLRYAKAWHCAIESRGVSYYVDVHDDDDISIDALHSCDVYLKRSFNPLKQMSDKVRPLGLNYQVYADGRDWFEFVRRLKLEGHLAAAKYPLSRRLRVSEFESPPSRSEPSVLFLCRAWEPEPNRSTDKNEERIRISESRAECVAALRKEFGSRCIAGLSPSDYAVEHFPHAIVNDARITERRKYLRLVRSTPVCVATAGLHESNGWKVGEYVAHSRAIVCEELRHSVPEFLAGHNYLPFRTVSECVEAVGVLMESKSIRDRMAEANRDYYLRRLRPDRMMSSALIELAPTGAGLQE